MGKLVFGMMQSLDGYVAGATGGPGSDGYVAGLAAGLELPPPGVSLARHFNDHVRSLAGSLCGRRMYEVMRYWDDDKPNWDVGDHDFAAVWRAKPKWVVSRSLKSLGANATLVASDVEAFVLRLKAEVEGEIDVAGPELAGCLTDVGLIDEYRLYFRPFVLGRGKPYFAGARPPLRLIAAECVMVCLNGAHHAIGWVNISSGGLDSALADPPFGSGVTNNWPPSDPSGPAGNHRSPSSPWR